MSDRIIVVVPTRSRPGNVTPLVRSWRQTGAFDDGAEMVLVTDADDPWCPGYDEAFAALEGNEDRRVTMLTATHWRPLVPKLNDAADYLNATQGPYALGFMGDDHRPRTPGWVRRYREELATLGTGVVSCSDGYRKDDLPTQWVMTADIVKTLRGMVPAPVEHLYCDDAIREFARDAGCYHFLPDIVIDHMNPYAGQRSPMDEQYERVNGSEQYRKDRAAYRAWKRDGGLASAAGAVRALREQRKASA